MARAWSGERCDPHSRVAVAALFGAMRGRSSRVRAGRVLLSLNKNATDDRQQLSDGRGLLSSLRPRTLQHRDRLGIPPDREADRRPKQLGFRAEDQFMVGSDTPAASATARIEVATYPLRSNSALATARIRSRVSRACRSRRSDR